MDKKERRELNVDKETGDNVGRSSGGVAASISKCAVLDGTRLSNSWLAVGGVAGSLVGEIQGP